MSQPGIIQLPSRSSSSSSSSRPSPSRTSSSSRYPTQRPPSAAATRLKGNRPSPRNSPSPTKPSSQSEQRTDSLLSVSSPLRKKRSDVTTSHVKANTKPFKDTQTLVLPATSDLSASESSQSSSPTKATRRGGKANRQATPPPSIDGPIAPSPITAIHPPNGHPVAKAKKRESSTKSLLSRSAPTSSSELYTHRLPAPRSSRPKGKAETGSEEDECIMPSLSNKAVKQELTWQQAEALSSTHDNDRLSNSDVNADSKKMSRRSADRRTRTVSQNDTAVLLGPPSAVPAPSSALTWQQELLQQQPPRSTGSPSKNKRQQARDEQTFGADAALAKLSFSNHRSNSGKEPVPFPMDDLFYLPAASTSPSKTPLHGQQKKPALHHSSSSFDSRLSAPPKANGLPERYAGPTFHNSPSPASLPTPTFLARRSANGDAVRPT